MKTAELTDASLDWAAAKAEGRTDVRVDDDGELVGKDYFDYSTDWSQGGPIIERERIATSYHPNPFQPGWESWRASFAAWSCGGPTPLIAAMRCYVASKLGDEIEVPEKLK